MLFRSPGLSKKKKKNNSKKKNQCLVSAVIFYFCFCYCIYKKNYSERSLSAERFDSQEQILLEIIWTPSFPWLWHTHSDPSFMLNSAFITKWSAFILWMVQTIPLFSRCFSDTSFFLEFLLLMFSWWKLSLMHFNKSWTVIEVMPMSHVGRSSFLLLFYYF